MNKLSLHSMTQLLTVPYRRGAETLEILLGEDVGSWTSVADYDFTEYRARYQVDPPEPKYILFPLKDIGRNPLTIEVEFFFAGATQIKSLTIPPSTLARTSFAIPLPEEADATLRLQRFRQQPVPLAGTGADNWGIISLLGNIAKLSWVMGWEKDQIYQHLQEIQQQRYLPWARRFSLDKLGEDLGVLRFPPQEYSFDIHTIALYHFNDLVADGEEVTDDTTPFISRFGLSGHPGTNNGAQSGVVGKFGNGFRFPGSNGSGVVEIPTHPDFDLPGDRSFTVEAFVKAEARDDSDDSVPRVVIVKGQQVQKELLPVPDGLCP